MATATYRGTDEFIEGYEAEEVARSIAALTHHQIRDLNVEVVNDRLVVRGKSSSYYVKQLATQAVRTFYPDVELANEIAVGTCR